MNLTTEDLSKFTEFIKSKNISGTCPECKQNSGASALMLASNNIDKSGNISIGGSVAPFIYLTCNNCGNVRMFSAILAGVVPKK